MHPQGRPLSRQIDLNLLELFDITFRTRNLTATSVRLGLSQPAVSYGLSKLRKMYGDALFVRMQRGVQPTPIAMQLAGPIAAAMQIMRSTIKKVEFVPSEARRTFRVAMSDIGERYFLPRLAQRLSVDAPHVTVETLSPGLAELTDGLASGDIDLAIGFIPGMGKQIHEEVLFSEQFVYLMRNGHPAAQDDLTVARIRKLRHVVAGPPGTRHLHAVEKVLTSPQVRCEIVLHVTSFLCVGSILADTDLVALVPSNLAALVANNLNLCVCRPKLKFPAFDICMYWHRRLHQDPASGWLRKTVFGLFGSNSTRSTSRSGRHSARA
jgi:DNA-binding transcriptional LysR family regulator